MSGSGLLRVLLLLAGFLGASNVTFGKPFAFEGFVEAATAPYAAPVTHVLRFEPAGRIELALIDTPGAELQSRPLERVRVVGRLASDRVVEGVPSILVEEVLPAGWSLPRNELPPTLTANWRGFGSSLYPSLAEEPLPRAGFDVSPPQPPAFDPAKLLYVNGFFSFRVAGPNGWKCVVDASTDLVTWSPLATNVISEGEAAFTDNVPPISPRRFYRARLQP